MRGPLIAFAAGALAAHVQPTSAAAATLVAASCLLLLPVAAGRIPASLGLGFAWTALAIAAVSPSGDRGECESPVELLIAVEGLAVREGPSLRFEARVLRPAACGPARGERIRLGWMAPEAPAAVPEAPAAVPEAPAAFPEAPAAFPEETAAVLEAPAAFLAMPLPRPGQHWRVQARVERSRGTANAFAFDYERWLVRHRIVATGYVTAGALVADVRDPVDDWRLGLRDRVAARGLVHGGAILALATGDTALLSPDAWRLLRETATVHLLVISGLHVGMFAILGLGLGSGVARLLPVTRRCRARAVGGLVAVLAVAGYATAAGWTLPVTRAALMTAAGILAATVGRRARVSDAFALALAGLLALDPLAVLDTGFWLSFGAVGVLLAYFAPRTGGPAPAAPAGAVGRAAMTLRARGRELLVAQLVVAVGFAPLLGVFVGHVHPLAPAVNLVLIPLVTMVAAPMSVLGALLAGVLPGLADPLLALADATLGLVFRVVESAATVPGVPAGVAAVTVPGALALALAFLLPWSRLAHGVLAAGVVAILTRSEPQGRGGFQVTVLDVGQGAATLVRTRNHLLLHDTGPRFPSGFDVGEAIVVPHVSRAHDGRVTELVLSHADIDHVGGAAAVMRLLQVRGVAMGEPVPGLRGRACRAGDAWLWDGVVFRVLSPGPGHGGNDASCVIEVDDGRRRALLAGDIERAAERRVAVRWSTLLVVPHHGSRTSSTRTFVERACPRFAIVSAGFGNRFGHPHPEVVERYRSVGAHLLSTAVLGAIDWDSRAPEAVRVARADHRHWRADARPGFATGAVVRAPAPRCGAYGGPGPARHGLEPAGPGV